jgi:hypothetical protein
MFQMVWKYLYSATKLLSENPNYKDEIDAIQSKLLKIQNSRRNKNSC